MTRVTILFIALLAVAVNAASFHRQHKRQTNPFEGIPDLSSLGFCLTECAAVGEAQKNQSGDLSGACTTTFVSEVGTCMQCIGKWIPPPLLTDPIKQKIQDAMTSYESQCTAAGSPITVDFGSAFQITSTMTSTSPSGSATPTSTRSSTGAPSPSTSKTGAGHARAPSFGMAAAAAIALFAAF